MSNLPAGAQGQPLFTVVAGAVYYSADGGVTWTEAQAPGSPSNSSAPISGDGTVGTPFTIAAGAIALTKLHTQADSTVVGVPVGGGTESPIALTTAQLTALINAATTSLPGAMTAAQATSLATVAAGMFPLSMFLTGTVDFTAVQNITLPVVPGYFFNPSSVSVFTMTKAGTISTSFTANAGNDASKLNAFASQTPATTFFSGITTPPQLSGALTAAGGSAPAWVDLSTPITIQITSGATGTGGFAWTGKIRMYGTIFPAT